MRVQYHFHRHTFWGRQAFLLLLIALLMGLRAASPYFIHLSLPNTRWGPEPGIISYQAQKSPQGAVASHHARKKPPRAPLDINQATQKELMALPGIGPALAQRIVAYRQENGPFTEISEIKEVSGIGEKRYERIKAWIQVRRRER